MAVEDKRYVYGAVCTWHGPISEAKPSTPVKIELRHGTPAKVLRAAGEIRVPGCPHCGGPLMEYDDRQTWDQMLDRFLKSHPELVMYKEWIETLHAPCKPLSAWDWKAAYTAFLRERMVN